MSSSSEPPAGAAPERPHPRPAKARARRVPPLEATPALALADVAGVGPKTAERLAARGLHTVEDALLFLPRRYEDRRTFASVARLTGGEHATVKGTVVSAGVRFAGKRIFELVVREDPPADGRPPLNVACRWFRFSQAALEARFPRGQRVVASGTVSVYGALRQLVHPEVELLAPDEEARPAGLVPVYGEVEDVPPKLLRALLADLARGAALALEENPLPAELRVRLALPGLGGAVLRAHVPEAPDPLAAGDALLASPVLPGSPLHRRLVFDELFFFQLALARRRHAVEVEVGLVHAPAEPWPALARAMFPFPLTGAQVRALDELAADLARPRPMSRLLQGDVGAGKTAVALVAAAIVAAAGRQTALLAPTEILAEQHHRSALRAGLGARVALLTGSTRAKERRAILAALAAGALDLLVGTHALLEPDVVFRDLGLAIVDEQHRFGVEQRGALRAKSKGAPPDVLVMTATPIPRTLALTLYGDLHVTVIDELPPGRQPTVTRICPVARRYEVYRELDRALAAGRQVFVVYPLVEASEKLDLAAATDAVAALEERFAPHHVGLLHGRLRPEEKADTMARFLAGELALLVSTTVIEVGVDVPNATVMVLEHAERFGLSQIHQLRGRVGRGAHPGLCLLVVRDPSEAALERLAILEATSDGFLVAEHDLATRGGGEVFGTRQSGLPELALADLVRDRQILEEARAEAFAAVARDPELPALRGALTRRFRGRLDLADIG